MAGYGIIMTIPDYIDKIEKLEQENKQLKDTIKKTKKEIEKHLNTKSYGNHKYELFSREYLEELLVLLKEIK